jgi:hypothetical protein
MQFRLSTLLWLFVVLWTSMAMASALIDDPYTVPWIAVAIGWVFGGVMLCLGVAVAGRKIASLLGRPVQSSGVSNPLPEVFLSIVAVGCLAYLVILGGYNPGELRRRGGSANNLKGLGIALHCYGQDHGCLPPAHVVDKKGKPMHSWRSMILPYVEGDPAFLAKYSFGEAWNGPNNKKLLTQAPRMYVAPEDWQRPPQPLPSNASYVAIVGRKGAWRGDKALSFDDMRKPLSQTVWLIEVANSNIAWTEPRDVSWDDVPKLLNPSRGAIGLRRRRTPSGFFFREPPESVPVLLADGSAHYLSGSQLTPEGLQTALAVGGFVEEQGQSLGLRLNWRNCCTLLVWTASIYLLLRRTVRNNVAAAMTTGQGQRQVTPDRRR